MSDRIVIIETSSKLGWVALADGDRIVSAAPLDSSRRHARDLAPATADLLKSAGLKPTDVVGVIVSLGPGSYTGLRVGVMSATTLAYVVKGRILGVETFRAIVERAPAEARRVDVVADALQGSIYVQRFRRDPKAKSWAAESPLDIRAVADWTPTLAPDVYVMGPGLVKIEASIPASTVQLPAELAAPTPESTLRAAWPRWVAGESDDPFRMEPLYLRPSSAEKQWDALGK